MKTIKGDLVQLAQEGKFDVIVHGCNCQCRMARGIAATIKQHFPEAEAADLATEKGSRSKLGDFSQADIVRGNLKFSVINAYTQFDWNGNGVLADYEAIRQVMKSLKARFAGLRIGYPKIGAGLAGGDWTTIEAIIREELSGTDHTCVEYTTQPGEQQ